MGAALTHLEEPIREKDEEDGEVPTRARYGASGMQGWRRGQEDAHLLVSDLDGSGRVSLFGVFDGHGGRGVARYAATHLPGLVKSSEGYAEGEYGKALRTAFLAVDDGLKTAEGRTETAQLDSSTTPESSRRIPVKLPRGTVQRLKAARGSASTASDADAVGETGSHGRSAISGDRSSGDGTASTVDAASSGDGSSGDGTADASAAAGSAMAGIEVEAGSDAAASTSKDPTADDNGDADSDASDGAGEDDDESDTSLDLDALDPQADGSDDDETEWVDMDPRTLLKDPTPEAQGCTAVVALVAWGDAGQGAAGARLVVANAGDSRCILCRTDGAIAMSEDHKPELASETKRIEAAGGHVKYMPGGARVQGDLNLSRALGDLRYKQSKELPAEEQIVTAEPEIRERVLEAGDKLLVLGCDGIWETNENEPLAKELMARLGGSAQELALSRVCGEVCDKSLCPSMSPAENPGFDGSGCDNMTIVIVELESAGRRREADGEPPCKSMKS